MPRQLISGRPQTFLKVFICTCVYFPSSTYTDLTWNSKVIESRIHQQLPGKQLTSCTEPRNLLLTQEILNRRNEPLGGYPELPLCVILAEHLYPQITS